LSQSFVVHKAWGVNVWCKRSWDIYECVSLCVLNACKFHKPQLQRLTTGCNCHELVLQILPLL